MRRNYMANSRPNGNRIKTTVARESDKIMKTTMKKSGFTIVDENDRVSTVKNSISAYKANMSSYNILMDSAVGKMKKTRL